MNKKTIWWGLLLILLCGGALGFGFKVYQATKLNNLYQADLAVINATYVNKKDRSLVERIPVQRLQKIPQDYQAFAPSDPRLHTLKKAYQRLKPLYQNQVYVQQQTAHLFDGAHYYRNTVTRAQLNHLNRRVADIYNLRVQGKLVNQIDLIALWFKQTTKAATEIKQIYQATIKQHQRVSYNQYITTKANQSLLKNRQQKKQLQPQIKAILQQYENTQHNQAQQTAQAQAADIERIKKQALTTNNYAPAQVTINLITKLDQAITTKLQQKNITAPLAIFINHDNVYIVQKQQDYYQVKQTLAYQGSLQALAPEYTVEFAVGNNLTTTVDSYQITKDTVFIIAAGASNFTPNTVLNKGSDFNLAHSDYLNLSKDQGFNPSLIALADDQEPLFLTTSVPQRTAVAALTLSTSDFQLLINTITTQTPIIIDH